MTETLELPRLRLLDGYVARPLTLDDAEQAVQLWDAVAQHAGISEQNDVDDIRTDWTSPDFQLETASQAVLAPDGEMVATVVVWDTHETPVHPWLGVNTHPDHLHLTAPLLEWAEQRARQAIDRCPPEARVSARCGSFAGYEPKEMALRTAGFTPIRNTYRMRIDMDEAPPEPTLPDGISMRSYRHPDELEALVKAENEGFRDHFGYVEMPFDKQLAEWKHFMETDKLFDPNVFFLAIDDATGNIAGVSLCRKEEWGDPTVAYVEALAVLPAYRKRGLGLALLHYTFAAFYRRGQQHVTLHVDASSLTGAVRLYERAGMHIDRQFTLFEKELRPGEEIETTAASDA